MLFYFHIFRYLALYVICVIFSRKSLILKGFALIFTHYIFGCPLYAKRVFLILQLNKTTFDNKKPPIERFIKQCCNPSIVVKFACFIKIRRLLNYLSCNKLTKCCNLWQVLLCSALEYPPAQLKFSKLFLKHLPNLFCLS